MTLAPCVYCGAPWPYFEAEIDHAPSCPTVTGVYPVRPSDVRPHGFGCLGCGVPFKVGDVYVLSPLEQATPHVGCYGVACLTCTAFDRVAP